jgi:hypothetical protein
MKRIEKEVKIQEARDREEQILEQQRQRFQTKERQAEIQRLNFEERRNQEKEA